LTDERLKVRVHDDRRGKVVWRSLQKLTRSPIRGEHRLDRVTQFLVAMAKYSKECLLLIRAAVAQLLE
jgi:hypothetical protein